MIQRKTESRKEEVVQPVAEMEVLLQCSLDKSKELHPCDGDVGAQLQTERASKDGPENPAEPYYEYCPKSTVLNVIENVRKIKSG